MAAPSAGDIIAAITLIRDVAISLSGRRGATAQFSDLVGELKSLEDALVLASKMPLAKGKKQRSLQRAVRRCHLAVEGFSRDMEKYQPYLQGGGSGNRMMDAFKRMQFGLTKQEDVTRFRGQLQHHLQSIQIIIQTANHAENVAIREQLERKAGKRGRVRRSITSSDSEYTSGDAITSNDTWSSTLGTETLDEMSSELSALPETSDSETAVPPKRSTGRKAWVANTPKRAEASSTKRVRFAQQSGSGRIPPQVLLKAPIDFEDAVGGRYALHTEWVTEWKEFSEFVLSKFKKASHRHKFLSGEYLLRRADSKEHIATYQDFATVFKPADHIQMSVIFPNDDSRATCPKCESELGKDMKEQICSSCNTWIETIEPTSESVIDSLTETVSDYGFLDYEKPLIEHMPEFLRLLYEADKDLTASHTLKTFSLDRPEEECLCDAKDFSRITLCSAKWPPLPGKGTFYSPIQRLESSVQGIKKRIRSGPPADAVLRELAKSFINKREEYGSEDKDFLSGAYELAYVTEDVRIHLQHVVKALRAHPHQYKKRLCRYRCLAWMTAQFLDNSGSLFEETAQRFDRCFIYQETLPEGSSTIPAAPQEAVQQADLWGLVHPFWNSEPGPRSIKSIIELVLIWASFLGAIQASSNMEKHDLTIFNYILVPTEGGELWSRDRPLFHLLLATLLLESLTNGSFTKEVPTTQNLTAAMDYFSNPHLAPARTLGSQFRAHREEWEDEVQLVQTLIREKTSKIRGQLERNLLKMHSVASAMAGHKDD